MDKALFNKKYGLQSAVLEGRKNQTRRICRNQVNPSIEEAKWKVGEEVAVAQSYDDIYMEKNAPCPIPDEYRLNAYNKGFNQGHKGWKNKLFVIPADMPFRIKITNIRVERLQDISDEDCLKEGITSFKNKYGVDVYSIGNGSCFSTAKLAFAALIDKVSGKGTWDSNPWVHVYDFELVR